MKAWARLVLTVCVVAAAGARVASAQIRGTVRDSLGRQPIPSAAVTLLDSAGATLGRVITNTAGVFQFSASTLARRVRVQRLGFRPADADVPRAAVAGPVQVDVILRALPSILQGVKVAVSTRCPARPDDDVTYALLQQARSGLLSIVVGREANPGALIRVTYRRQLEGGTNRIIDQEAHIDSTGRSATSFQAERSVDDYVRNGFRKDVGALESYSGPDADVLLDEKFQEGYCFHVAPPSADRRNQVGLGFSPVDRRDNRIDVEGALWIDTVARSLQDIEFRFLGLGKTADAMHPGGHTSFRTMKNGVVLIDRWVVRSPRLESLIDGHAEFGAYETGGELARAAWPDGTVYEASLGTLRVRVLNPLDRPAAGMLVHLSGTDYSGLSDENGNTQIKYLIPGPYAVRAGDARLAPLGISDRTPMRFTAARDSVIRGTVHARSLFEYVFARCAVRDSNPGTEALVIGSVRTSDGYPVPNLKVNFTYPSEKPAWRTIRTLSDGVFTMCLGPERKGATFKITTRTLRGIEAGVIRTLSDSVTVVPLHLAAGSASELVATSADSRVTVNGVAYDSLHDRPLRGAVIGMTGSGRSAVSDSAGVFHFIDVRLGPYTFTVQHDAFDAIGMSGATSVDTVFDGRDSVQLFVPSLRRMWRRLCGDSIVPPNAGIYYGSAAQRATVTARWTTSGGASGQLSARADSTGGYALCGIPRDATDIRLDAGREGSPGPGISVDALSVEPVRWRDLRKPPT